MMGFAYFAYCSADALNMMFGGLPPNAPSAGKNAPIRHFAASSATTTCPSTLSPAPPNSSGVCSAHSPSARACSCSPTNCSRGNPTASCSSFSSTGCTWAVMKRRTVSRSITSSSGSSQAPVSVACASDTSDSRGCGGPQVARTLQLRLVIRLVLLDPFVRQVAPGLTDPEPLGRAEHFGGHHVTDEDGVLVVVEGSGHPALDIAVGVEQDRGAGDTGLGPQRGDLVAVAARTAAEGHQDLHRLVDLIGAGREHVHHENA